MTSLPIVGSKWVKPINGKIYVVTGFQLIDDAVFVSYRRDADKRSDHWLGAEEFLERFTEMKETELSMTREPAEAMRAKCETKCREIAMLARNLSAGQGAAKCADAIAALKAKP